MRDRILITAVALLAIVSLASVALAWFALEQGRSANLMLLSRLDELSPAPQSLDWTEAAISVLKGSGQGPPAVGWKVQLYGPAINPGQQVTLPATIDAHGVARFGPVRPGQYRFSVFSEWGDWWSGGDVMLWPGKPYTQTVIGPAQEPPKHPVEISINWPSEPPDQEMYLYLTTTPADRLTTTVAGQWVWSIGIKSHFLLRADGQAFVADELPTLYGPSTTISASILPFNPVAYPAGTYRIMAVAALRSEAESPGAEPQTFTFINSSVSSGPWTVTVEEGRVNRLELDISQEFVEAMRRAFDQSAQERGR